MARNRLDGLGITLSGLCLLHCLIVPVTAGFAPALAHGLHLPEWTHVAMLGAALPVAVAALGNGWRQHRRRDILALGIAGLALLVGGIAAHEGLIGGTAGHWLDPVLTSAGAILLGTAHWHNWRLGKGRG